MSQPLPSYVDGYASAERKTSVIPDVDFPFENYATPDTYARLLAQGFDVPQPRFFTPKIGVRTSWTNYLSYSEAFANAAWTKTNITNTDAQAANPNDGLVTMALGLETVTNAEHAYQKAYTFTATQHTLSWIVRPNGRTWFRLKANDGTTNFTAFFNLTGAGYAGALANCTAAVALLSDGTYRISITFTPLASAGNVYLNYATDGSTVSYPGNTALGAYVWGAQIVRAATAGPVIITTTVAREVSAPNLDDGDPFAYLVWERPPQNYDSAVASVLRKFARIPAPQTSFPGSRYFGLPAVTNDFDGLSSLTTYNYPLNANIGDGFYNTAAAAIYTASGQALYGPVKTLGAKVIGYASGGTFTLTFGASTTGALNWNDSGATIATEINGLASVIAAGLTCTVTNSLNAVTGGTLAIVWTVGGTLASVTMNSSLTLTASNHPTTQVVNSANQVIRMADNYGCAAHGLNTSLALAAVRSTDSILVFATANWGSVDADTLWLPTSGSVGDYVYVGTFNRQYVTAGTYLLRTKEIETFYLPGVTAGISTVADIVSPIGLQNASDFIAALMSLTGFQTYQSEGPAPWMGTLIHSVKSVQINLSDIT